MDQRDLLQAGFRYAFSLTHNQHEAEDLVQDVWLKLYEKEGKISSKSLFYVSIKNLFIDKYRKKKLFVVDEYEDLDSIQDIKFDITLNEIEKCLEKLRPEEREVLFLSGVEEYTASEIAELINQPRSTVLSLMSRGKKKFISAYNYLFSSKIKDSSS